MVWFRSCITVTTVAIAVSLAGTTVASQVYTVRAWTKTSGETISGRFERFDGQDVIISAAGKQLPVPFYDLNVADQEFLRKGLAGGSSERLVPPPMIAPPLAAPAVTAPDETPAPVATPAVALPPVAQPAPAVTAAPAPVAAPPVVSPASIPQPQPSYTPSYTPAPQSTNTDDGGGGEVVVVIPVGLIAYVIIWICRSQRS
jgi:hypothetical protein